MGRAARWFKRLLGMNKSKERIRVSGGDSEKGGEDSEKGGGDSEKGGEGSGECNLLIEPVWLSTYLTDTEKEQNKHAIAVATATASAAEAAVSAAKAAAAVVRLTSEGRAGDIIMRKELWATVKIQKVFRGSLARKALRALKGIVKLQALVRGYLVRKRAAAMLQSIQALIRVQTAMRFKRTNRCLNNKEYNDNMIQPRRSLDEATYNERSPKIVEMDDTYKRRSSSRWKSRQARNVVTTMSEYEDDLVYNGNDLELSFSEEKWKFATSQNTPRLSYSSQHHAANNRYYVMQSPGKSVCGNALYEYESSVSTPGYMDKTQSFKAKVRSHSAPRQRYERKRLSLDEVMATRSSVSGLNMLQQQQQPQRYSCSYDPC